MDNDYNKRENNDVEKEKSARKKRLWCYRVIALLGLIAIILILIFKPVHCDCDCEEKVSKYISSQVSSQQSVEPTAPLGTEG